MATMSLPPLIQIVGVFARTSRFGVKMSCMLMLLSGVTHAACFKPGANIVEASRDYGKTVIVLGMPQRYLSHQQVGAIANLGSQVAHRLVNQINDGGEHWAIDASHFDSRSLPKDVVLDPERVAAGVANPRSKLWRSDLPLSQFIVTGSIENTQLADDRGSSFISRQIRRPMSLLKRDFNQPRRFEWRLKLIDRYSGRTLLERSYQQQANWGFDITRKVATDDPHFWQSHYGRKLSALIATASKEIVEVLNCEPLLAQIVSVDNANLYIAGAYNSGLQAGDKLQLLKHSELRLVTPAVATRAASATIEQVEGNGFYARFARPQQWNLVAGDLIAILPTNASVKSPIKLPIK